MFSCGPCFIVYYNQSYKMAPHPRTSDEKPPERGRMVPKNTELAILTASNFRHLYIHQGSPLLSILRSLSFSSLGLPRTHLPLASAISSLTAMRCPSIVTPSVKIISTHSNPPTLSIRQLFLFCSYASFHS